MRTPIKKADNAIRNHVDEDDKLMHQISASGQNRNMLTINESGLYSLILGSKLESAKKFKRWVTSEVLPSIRKTGSYTTPKQPREKKPSLASINMAARNIMKTYEQAGVDPKFTAVAVNNLYKEQAGISLPLPIEVDVPRLYDLTEMARELGVLSSNGNPHSTAIGAIIKKLHVPESEIVITPFSRNGHDDFTTQYKPSVFEDVRFWLSENGYPIRIPDIDSKGNQKTYKVVYQEVA